MKWLAGLSLLVVFSAGCGAGDVCQEASEHVAMCTSSEAAPLNSCNETQAALAEDLLAMECHEIQLYQSSGKAEVKVDSEDQDHNFYDVCDPEESDTCDYCNEIDVEFELLGISVGSCLVSNKCEYVDEGPHQGQNLCSCTFWIGSCADEQENEQENEPDF